MGLLDYLKTAADYLRTATGLARTDPASTPSTPARAEGRRATESAASPLASQKPVYVRSRAGSMLLDEDGDEAHEFFEENDQGKVVPVTRNLTPQGEVPVVPPRLHCDLGIVLCTAPTNQ